MKAKEKPLELRKKKAKIHISGNKEGKADVIWTLDHRVCVHPGPFALRVFPPLFSKGRHLRGGLRGGSQ